MSTITAPVTHPVKLTERINRIEPSATMAVVAEADKLRQQGIDVVDFGAGEPHFSTPQHVKDAAIAAIQANFSKYTAVGGTAELKDAIVHRHAVDFDSDYRREEVDGMAVEDVYKRQVLCDTDTHYESDPQFQSCSHHRRIARHWRGCGADVCGRRRKSRLQLSGGEDVYKRQIGGN